MTEEIIENKQLKLFLAIAFGLPVIMGLFMWYGYSNGTDLNLFAMAHMYYPAAGVMIAMLAWSKNKQLLPKAFFYCYLAQAVLLIGLCLAGLFIDNENLAILANVVMMGGTILLWITLAIAKKQRREAFGLRRKNWKKTIGFVLLFVALYCLRMLIALVAGDTLNGFISSLTSPDALTLLAITIFTYFVMFTPYFGEEYGWRYFLQPILFKKLGHIKGILVLGVIWGIWHLPLNFFYYTSPADGLISVVNQIFVCIGIGILLAYVYMKTDNIWAAVMIHFLNNNLAPFFAGDLTAESMSGYSIGWFDVLGTLILSLVFFGWPILTKYFRNQKNSNPTAEVRAGNVSHEAEAKRVKQHLSMEKL